MKKIILILFILVGFAQSNIKAQTIAVPDIAFLNFLKTNFPAAINSSDELIVAQAATYTGTLNCSNNGIVNLEGIQYFSNIRFLQADNNSISLLPSFSTLTKLQTLDLQSNNLSTIPDLSMQTALQKLFLSKNKLTKLPDLTNNINLVQLISFSNKIDTLPFINHLVNLKKIDVGNNPLKKLPDMTGLIQLEQLLIWKNMLDSIPDLKNYPNLWRLNAGNNKLLYTPDFSFNTRMKILHLDSNQLTTLPDISLLDSLDDVRFQTNNFDFQDLSTILFYPGRDTIFSYSPQTDFLGGTINVLPNDSLIIPSGIVPYGVTTYQWYFEGSLKYTTTTPSLKIYPAISGQYYVSASSSAFSGLTLRTLLFNVTALTCIDLSGISFDIDGIKCLQPGELWINSSSLPTGNYSYSLIGASTNKIFISNSGRFKNLAEPTYTLTISNGLCSSIYSNPIKIPMEECKETFITPNGDGDKDNYFFNHSGKVVIYDKQGVKVKMLDLPGEWDATNKDGKLVAQGYYICNVNDGEDQVNISVVY